MIRHSELGPESLATARKLKTMIDDGKIAWAGNRQPHIYGTLSCKSGKRMKRTNRVFFGSEKEAIEMGFRPCGHCMREAYRQWKRSSA